MHLAYVFTKRECLPVSPYIKCVVWKMQGAGNVNLFIKEFKLRLIDCFKQDRHAALGSHYFYNVYSNFNQSLVLSQYFRTHNNIGVREYLLDSELECLH